MYIISFLCGVVAVLIVETLSDYCPNCGAKMDEERRTDNAV